LRSYHAYGLTLDSEIELPELEGATAPAEIAITLDASMAQLEGPWVHTWIHEDEPWLASMRTAGGYGLRFFGMADYLVDAAHVRCAPRGIAMETLRHQLLDQVLPFLLGLRGGVAIHATAVRLGRAACAFVATSGTGKSTLAASFGRAGYPVLNDDCLPFAREGGRIVATPGYAGVRVTSETAHALGIAPSGPVAENTNKQRALVGAHPQERVPLARVYLLEVGAAPGIAVVPPAEAFVAVIASMYRIDPTDKPAMKRQFDAVSELLEIVPPRRLIVPRDFAQLAAVRELVLADVRSVSVSVSVSVTGACGAR
jgi:hypothetical protein